MPGVYDPISARTVEETGHFEALKLIGSGTVFSRTGLPDAGLATMTEMVDHAKTVQESVDLPLLVDADNGYGDATNVVRTVKEFIKAGVAGIHIEDQVSPKRNADVRGVKVLPIEKARLKIRAATDTRDDHDEDFVVIARTDARRAANHTIDDAIERANAFLDEEADAVFLKVPESLEEVRRVGREVDGPLMYPCSGTAVRLDPKELEEYGWDIAFYGRMIIHPTILAIRDAANRFNEKGINAVDNDEERFHEHYSSVHHLAGINKVAEIETKYLPASEQEKYNDTTGHDIRSG
jgi:2-methylisocitrate lyase-like PEP mutase family enzyme